mmetsp:Transcript_1689/g.4054  ORF Transcript_1689/g.4054 Transcript_1689/m.4054 type:complete len:216 (-) Transcript_1689:163-810(-)
MGTKTPPKPQVANATAAHSMLLRQISATLTPLATPISDSICRTSAVYSSNWWKVMAFQAPRGYRVSIDQYPKHHLVLCAVTHSPRNSGRPPEAATAPHSFSSPSAKASRVSSPDLGTTRLAVASDHPLCTRKVRASEELRGEGRLSSPYDLYMPCATCLECSLPCSDSQFPCAPPSSLTPSMTADATQPLHCAFPHPLRGEGDNRGGPCGHACSE